MTVTLTALAAVETIALVLIAFDAGRSWLLVLSGTSALGVIYTGIGAAVATRYASINALLLPASVVVTLLLAPLLAHVGLAPRSLFVAASYRTGPDLDSSGIRRLRTLESLPLA